MYYISTLFSSTNPSIVVHFVIDIHHFVLHHRPDACASISTSIFPLVTLLLNSFTSSSFQSAIVAAETAEKERSQRVKQLAQDMAGALPASPILTSYLLSLYLYLFFYFHFISCHSYSSLSLLLSSAITSTSTSTSNSNSNSTYTIWLSHPLHPFFVNCYFLLLLSSSEDVNTSSVFSPRRSPGRPSNVPTLPSFDSKGWKCSLSPIHVCLCLSRSLVLSLMWW